MAIRLPLVEAQPPSTATLVMYETIIERGLASFIEVGRALMAIKVDDLYKRAGYTSFDAYLARRWPSFEGGRRYADRVIGATKVVENLGPIGPILPATETQARPLVALKEPELQREAWQRVLRTADSTPITAELVTRVCQNLRAELAAERRPRKAPARRQSPTVATTADPSLTVAAAVDDESPPCSETATEEPPSIAPYYMVDAWNQLSGAEQLHIITHAADDSGSGFNRTNDNVEWALWTWNPVTGCDHGCDYCYARDIANRFYEDLPEDERFAPVFRPSRLHAPRRMKVPGAAAQNVGERNVFTGSMTDLFGKWVPQGWIDAVFAEVVGAPDWNFLFLTKFPQRLAEQDWPDNAWVGTTVDRQARVATAERSFRGVRAGIKWLSCEPMLERLTFTSLEMFDWVVIGGASESSQTPASQPQAEWVEHLVHQARAAGCQIYFKTNLGYRPREYPQGVTR